MTTGAVPQITTSTAGIRYHQNGSSLSIGSMTDRDAKHLAGWYGFEAVEAFSESLPSNAEVIDVGAGLSNFGHIVTSQRPDIDWTNLDIAYEPDLIEEDLASQLESLRGTAPDNLHYVTGNILELPEQISGRRYNRVLSYFMLDHVLANGREAGIVAVRNMFDITDSEGSLSIGPFGSYTPEPVVNTLTLAPPRTPEATQQLAGCVVDAILET